MATVINANSDASQPTADQDISIGTKSKNGKKTVLTPQKTMPLVNRSTAARMLEEQSIFTFKPKVSPQSVKIAESLGSDFMSRQQQHLERQKKLYIKPTNSCSTLSIGLKKRLSVETEVPAISRGADQTMKAWATPESDGTVVGDIKSPIPECHSDHFSPTLLTTDQPEANGTENVKPKLSPNANGILDDGVDDGDHSGPSRSKTMPPGGGMGKHKLERKATSVGGSTDRVRNAKLTAERAMKNRKIFTIQGPYPAIREGLRRRGWVEKFYKLHMAPPPKKSPRNKRRKQAPTETNDEEEQADDDDDDDDDDDNTDDDDDDDQANGKVPPWEEENGVYGIMSRIIRNVTPTFIWSVRRDVIDPKALQRDQMINHFGKATFTTKVGLCMNIRNVPWFESTDPNTFFPRCYRLSHEEEKQAFIDDYRMTACINILKFVHSKSYKMPREAIKEDGHQTWKSCTNPECTKSEPNQMKPNMCIHEVEMNNNNGLNDAKQNPLSSSPVTDPKAANKNKRKHGGVMSMKAVDFALKQCQTYMYFRAHEDIDQMNEKQTTEAEWEMLIAWYYQLVHDHAVIPGVHQREKEIGAMLDRIKNWWQQSDMDGYRNVWIVKPGAKSRGRGIMCYDKLEEMLKLVSASVMKDGKFVVQKYIERPLLIYNTKFDIRQWFLVTDWNPLTIWFYKDSYLRFCSQEYTLDDYDSSIHLSNNAIQKYCTNGPRSSKLPNENMWDSDQFKQYLASQGLGKIWDDLIYPGMKKAVLCALLCTQDIVEYRKSAFELYGADFMLTTDYHPWLIEINSSPSMSYGTKITQRMCADVLDDTVKVVLDRKLDKNCDVGRFELAYKQPMVSVPPYIGLNLSLDGTSIKRPSNLAVRRSEPSSFFDFNRSSINHANITRKTISGLQDQLSEKVDKTERLRILSNMNTREGPKLSVGNNQNNKGAPQPGPAGGRTANNTSSNNSHNSTSTKPTSEPAPVPEISANCPFISTTAPRMIVGTNTNTNAHISILQKANPITAAIVPKLSTALPGVHYQTLPATPLNLNLKAIGPLTQKLWPDTIPPVNPLRRNGDVRKLNDMGDADRDVMLSNEYTGITSSIKQTQQSSGDPGVTTEGLIQGHKLSSTPQLTPGAWARYCSNCGKCRQTHLEVENVITLHCQHTESLHNIGYSQSGTQTGSQHRSPVLNEKPDVLPTHCRTCLRLKNTNNSKPKRGTSSPNLLDRPLTTYLNLRNIQELKHRASTLLDSGHTVVDIGGIKGRAIGEMKHRTRCSEKMTYKPKFPQASSVALAAYRLMLTSRSNE